MPALPAIVTSYIDGLIADLQQGNPLDLLTPAQTHAAGVSFLRAMDLATAVELLQSALSTSVALTATGGSTTTVVDGASTFTANREIGNYVLFASNTTTVALRGVQKRITANTTTTLTVETLPAVCAVGDTYNIVGGFMIEDIAKIRAGKAKGEPVVPIYADSRMVNSALLRMYQQLGGTVNNLKQTVANLKAGTGSTASQVVVNVSSPTGIGKNMRVDEFKNMEVTVAALGTVVIDRNDETTLYLRSPLTGSAVAADAITIRNPQLTSTEPAWHYAAFNGGHGQNVLFGDLLDRVRDLVVSITLPV